MQNGVFWWYNIDTGGRNQCRVQCNKIIRGHPKESGSQTRAVRELGVSALCPEANNMIFYGAI